MATKKIEIQDSNGNIYYPHTDVSVVKNMPTTMKNPNALTISLNGTSQGAYDGGAAKSINITPSGIGAAESSHGNHVPATQTASNKKFLRNDNTWQDVTPDNIGAAATGHTHDDRYYTESEINTELSAINTSLKEIAKGVTDFDVLYVGRGYDVGNGTQKVATTFKPRAIICNACVNSQKLYSNGFYSDEKEYVIANPNSEAASSLISLKDSAGVIVQGKVTLIEDDGFTITWTTTGTPAFSNTIEMCFLLFK